MWVDTTVREMFGGLMVLMLLVKKHNIHDYWTKNTLIHIPAFGKFRTRDRYQLILKYTHFNENNNTDGGDGISKIRPVFNVVMVKFRDLIHLYQKLVIDESLILFRGRIVIRQYF